MRCFIYFLVIVVLSGCGPIFYNNDDFNGTGSSTGDVGYYYTGATSPGLYANDLVEITLTSADADTIYYSTDGSEPTSGTGWGNPVTINATAHCQLQVVAMSGGSEIGRLDITVSGPGESEANPYIITSAIHLSNVRYNPGSCFRQDGYISLAAISSGKGWLPIAPESGVGGFTGIYDGNNDTIDGLTIYNRDSAGLFKACVGAVIKNVNLTGIVMDSISNKSGTLMAAASSGTFVTNCSVDGSFVAAADQSYLGGMFGLISSGATIIRCSSAVIVSGSYRVGGFAGTCSGEIYKCSSTAGVSGGVQYSGGFIGILGGGTVSSSFSISTVTMTGSYNTGGGFVGRIEGGVIENCYSTGSITGYNIIGGFVGGVFSSSAKIRNCYSIGAVTASGGSTCGGFGGTNSTGTGIDESCYWDTSASGQTIGWSDSYYVDTWGNTTANMYSQSTYTNWDFTTVWTIVDGSGYPTL